MGVALAGEHAWARVLVFPPCKSEDVPAGPTVAVHLVANDGTGPGQGAERAAAPGGEQGVRVVPVRGAHGLQGRLHEVQDLRVLGLQERAPGVLAPVQERDAEYLVDGRGGRAEAEHGGGIAVNRATIFARLPEGAKRPMKGCHPDDMKAFIQEAYNDLRWFDANGQAPTAAPEVQRTATMQPPTRTPSQPSAPPVVHAKSAPPPSGDAHPHPHPHPKPNPTPNPKP